MVVGVRKIDQTRKISPQITPDFSRGSLLEFGEVDELFEVAEDLLEEGNSVVL